MLKIAARKEIPCDQIYKHQYLYEHTTPYIVSEKDIYFPAKRYDKQATIAAAKHYHTKICI